MATIIELFLVLCVLVTLSYIEAFSHGKPAVQRRMNSLFMGIRTQRFRALNKNKLKREERLPLLTLEQKRELFEKMEEWAEQADVKDFWNEGSKEGSSMEKSANVGP